MAKYQLTPNKLLILAAVRHLQPCGLRQIADFLNKPTSTIVDYVCGQKTCFSSLIDQGYIAHISGKHGAFRLTEAGKQEIRDICLICEAGRYSVGQIIRRYEQEAIK